MSYQAVAQQGGGRLLYAAGCNSSVTVLQTPEPYVNLLQTFDSTVQDPLSDGNQANVIALDIRKRKGLKPNPSPLNEYEDKL